MKKRAKYIKISKMVRDIKKRGFTLFTINDISGIYQISPQKTAQILSRAKRAGYLQSPAKGMYFIKDSSPHYFTIANKIYRPSYISLETALAYYKIIPETVYSITSITTRLPKTVNVLGAQFEFHKIKKELFFGYKTIAFGTIQILLAEKEKALLDYLYFVARNAKRLNERIDISAINKNKFESLKKQFLKRIFNKYITERITNLSEKLF